MRPLILSLLLALLTASAPAQDAKSGARLLQDVGERYGALKKFHFEAVEVTTTRSGDFERTTKNRVVTALDGAGRSRVEFFDGTTGGVTVSNGDTTWVYFPHLKKYSKFSGMPLDGADSKLGKLRGLDFSRIAHRFTERYKATGQSVIEAKIVRSEAIEIAGKSYNCQVIEARYETPQGLSDGQVHRTFWIDTTSQMIWRELSNASMKPANLDKPVQVRQQIEFRVADDSVTDDLFVFHPPEGAEEVGSADIQGGNGASLTGKPAPEFELHDLAGNNVTLAALRGEVVVLDFWATWCTPCRVDMPRLEALHTELKERGLRVFGVNGEDAGVARGFVESNGYTFPTLSDPGMKVASLYEVTAIPTAVVIDKQGKVGAYFQGSGSKEHLLEAVRKAGLE